MLVEFDINDNLKDVIFQVLYEGKSYLPPRDIALVVRDLRYLGVYNLWYRFFPLLLLNNLHINCLVERRTVAKLVKQCVISLHKLWIGRYSIIYIKSADNVVIEELNDL